MFFYKLCVMLFFLNVLVGFLMLGEVCDFFGGGDLVFNVEDLRGKDLCIGVVNMEMDLFFVVVYVGVGFYDEKKVKVY